MFTSVEETKELTGYDVENTTIIMAQGIIEAYVGRIEAQVFDPTDRALLTSATAYQAAYMNENSEMIFEQVAASYIAQFGQAITFRGSDMASPFVSPLAQLACSKLSWKRNRSVRTGSIYDAGETAYDWRTD